MVVIHIKKSDGDGFLYETTCDASNDAVIREIVSWPFLRCEIYTVTLNRLKFGI